MIPAQRSGAACKSSKLDGSGNTKSRRATANSAYPPFTVYPVNVGTSQRFSIPCLQYQQLPSVPPTHDTPTRAPTGSSPDPPSTTSPTIWCPGITSGRIAGSSPSTICKSVLQTPQARTRSKTCPGPGAGFATSPIVRGVFVFGALRYAAFIASPAAFSWERGSSPPASSKREYLNLPNNYLLDLSTIRDCISEGAPVQSVTYLPLTASP